MRQLFENERIQDVSHRDNGTDQPKNGGEDGTSWDMWGLRRSACLILLCLALVLGAYAQNEPPLHDQFGHIPLGDLSGRLDAFIFHMNENPAAKGFIRIYGNLEGWASFPHIRRAFYEAYLNDRGLNTAKVETQLCKGTEKELVTRFYIGRPEDSLFKCKELLTTPVVTTLIKSQGFYPVGSSDDYLGTQSVDAAAERRG